MASPENQSGREKLAQLRAAEEKKARTKKFSLISLAAVVVVALVISTMWLISSGSKSSGTSAIADGSYVKTMQSIPQSSFDAVGVGKAQADFTPIQDSTPMTEAGKPRILYVGAEFCPYCAMDRWSLVAALSRFGKFEGLGTQLSSSDEGEISNIPTVTFRNAKYTSSYVVFKPYETTDRNHNELMSLSSSDQALFQKYSPKGNIPWLNWGGTSESSTAYNDPSMAGKSGVDIAKMLNNPTSNDTAKLIIGAANIQTAKICQLTGGKPGSVCNSSGVKAAAATL